MDLGIQIVGVSFDSPSENASWSADQGFQYELWSDVDRSLAIYYGAGTASSYAASRVTKLLDEDGDLILEYVDVDLGIGAHPSDVLSDCQAIFGG